MKRELVFQCWNEQPESSNRYWFLCFVPPATSAYSHSERVPRQWTRAGCKPFRKTRVNTPRRTNNFTFEWKWQGGFGTLPWVCIFAAMLLILLLRLVMKIINAQIYTLITTILQSIYTMIHTQITVILLILSLRVKLGAWRRAGQEQEARAAYSQYYYYSYHYYH